jgi:signal transduction histidine kinase
MNLLIVDDYPQNLTLLRTGLEAAGHRVIESADGLEALEVLSREPVDGVIADILMPNLDGFRLCHEIRNSRRFNNLVPVILYTATYNSPSDRQLAATLGADAYLLKPAPVAVIVDAIRAAQKKAHDGVAAPARRRVDEHYVLEQYSAALVRKLEQRNTEMHDGMASLQAAHERIRELNQTLEARVAQRTSALAAANKELETFSFSVSHDLRAPLRHIAGFAQLLDESAGTQLDAENREFLGQIITAAKRMDQLIDAVIDFAHTSRTELEPAEVDLETILDEALAMLQTDIGRRNIRWQRSPLPTVRGDATLLRTVLVNLLSNAIKYSSTRDPALIEIGTRRGRAGESVVFVRDNGVGFDPRYAERLFGVFQRLHRADEFEGTGVGLANVQRIITRHGGTVWAEAAVNQGATFFFSLPRGDAP